MDLTKIMQIGYFDTVKLDGCVRAIHNSSGIDLRDGFDLSESIRFWDESFKIGLAYMRVSLIGICNIAGVDFYEREHMRDDRRMSGILKLPGASCTDKYLIAYADILLLKPNNSIPCMIQDDELDCKCSAYSILGKVEDDLVQSSYSPDISELISVANKLSEYIVSKEGMDKNEVSIAILDKLYVYPAFRRCHISSWLHENLDTIIHTYLMTKPAGVLLIPGDFSNEAERKFNMAESRYVKMLIGHYKTLGYRYVNNIWIPAFYASKNIMYKLYI